MWINPWIALWLYFKIKKKQQSYSELQYKKYIPTMHDYEIRHEGWQYDT